MNAQELAAEVLEVSANIKEAQDDCARLKRVIKATPFFSDEEASAEAELLEAEDRLAFWTVDLAQTLENAAN